MRSIRLIGDYRQAGSLSDHALSDEACKTKRRGCQLSQANSLVILVYSNLRKQDRGGCYPVFARCKSRRRSFNLPLCNWDFEVPALQPSIRAISSCS